MTELEKQIEEIRNDNQILLDKFAAYLKNKKLSQKTIDKHVSNVDFYINDFLLYYEPQLPEDGVYQIGSFLGDWFIRKALWASVTTIKENATSIKKFYQFMLDIGKIEKDDLLELKEEIKECKDDWVETLKKYDNPDIDLEDIW